MDTKIEAVSEQAASHNPEMDRLPYHSPRLSVLGPIQTVVRSGSDGMVVDMSTTSGTAS